MIVEYVLIVLSVALIADAFRKFWNMRGSHNSHVTKMYLLILLWWLSTTPPIQPSWPPPSTAPSTTPSPGRTKGSTPIRR
jgi:hypothetical protein